MIQPALQHRRITPPTQKELWIMRFLIGVGLILTIQFVWWYFQNDHSGHPILYGLLTLALGYKLLHLLYEWYYFSVMRGEQDKQSGTFATVDMLTTWVPGEPRDMVVATLKAMVKVRYPHTTYLCDEGDDPELKRVCKELGVVHVYRGKDKTGAKAGNINYALTHVAKGEICVILDPDHLPIPGFLDRVIPHFEDPEVGFVQCIQSYYNQRESLVARGAAEQTYLFYGPMMMGMHYRGTVQAIGANCTFRRAALDDIGGHASGLCEDMHTSMKLHAGKWRSVYLPELLTEGRTPNNLSAYYLQQFKWTRGSFELLFRVFPTLFRHFSWNQRLHYFLTPLYFLYGLIGLIDIGVPIVSLFTFEVPLLIHFEEFLWRILPLLASYIIIRYYAQQYVLDRHEIGFHTMGGILRVGTWWVYLLGLIAAIFRIRVPYIPTPKDSELQNDWLTSLPNLAMILASATAIHFGLSRDWNIYSWMMAGFAGMNIMLLSVVVVAGQQKLYQRTYYRLKESFLRPFLFQWGLFKHRYIYPALQHSYFSIFLSLTALGFSTLQTVHQESDPEGSIENHKKGKWYIASDCEGSAFFTSCSDVLMAGDGHAAKAVQIHSIAGLNESVINEWMIHLQHCRDRGSLPYFIWDNPYSAESNDSMSRESYTSHLDYLLELTSSFRDPVILGFSDWKNEEELTCDPFHDLLRERMHEKGISNLWKAIAFVPESGTGTERDDYDLIVIKPDAGEQETVIRQYERAGIQKPVLMISGSNSTIVNYTADGVSLPVRWKENYDPPCPGYRGSKRHALSECSPEEAEFPVLNNKPSPLPGTIGDQSRGVKGVYYNPGHDWRDGHWPPTRHSLETDLEKIRDMGANSITWYAQPVYNQNVVEIAEEKELQVLFGFHIDPSIDFAIDESGKEALQHRILSEVEKFASHRSIQGWIIGQETWQDLENHFHPPHLTEVRIAFVTFLQQLAAQIKEKDPSRKVICPVSAGEDFVAVLRELQHAPSVDVIGVNIHSDAHIAELQQLNIWHPDKSFLVTGFSPGKLYRTHPWEGENMDRLMELTSFEKARFYGRAVKEIRETQPSLNLGMVAYCWRDRYEGTATLSGLIDYKGRRKPSYFALKEAWTGESQAFPLDDLVLKYANTHQNGEYTLIFTALSRNNTQSDLHYEWYICQEGYVRRVDELLTKPADSGNFYFWVFSNYRQHLKGGLYPERNGKEVRIRNSDTRPYQRIYLHIYDDEGHVVTASYPI